MGVCESKANVAQHISQHSIEKLSENPAETAKLKALQHNHIIDKAKHIIDEANTKIRDLQYRCEEYKSLNTNLSDELSIINNNKGDKDGVTAKYKDQLDIQRETMLKWKEKIQTLSEEIVSIEQERKETDFKYKNHLLSINDTLYKVHGDNISKLKYSKQSQKFVIFTDKINHLFYYDEYGPKYIVISDISINNDVIEKQMNKPWFFVIGEKRSALFAADSVSVRDKWVSFVRKSLNNYHNSVTDSDDSISSTAINPMYSVDSSMYSVDKLGTNANHANYGTHGTNPNEFGKAQSPINIVSALQHKHCAKIMKSDEFESNPLKFNYPPNLKNCTIVNNGHTVQVNIRQPQLCTILINNEVYELKQFHFHTPSEHTIDNKKHEMEMHMVHMNKNNKIAVLGFLFTTGEKYKKPKLQLTKSRAHLVVNENRRKNVNKNYQNSKLQIVINDDFDEYDYENNASESDDMETDDEWEDVEKGKEKGNDFLSQFWEQLPAYKTEKDILLRGALSFDYLFETASDNFSKNVKTNEIDIDMEIFEYMGSLTTPPYTEGVQWLLSKRTHFINKKQLKKLSACWNDEDNSRAVQDYFGRTVSLRSKSSLRVVS